MIVNLAKLTNSTGHFINFRTTKNEGVEKINEESLRYFRFTS